MSKFLTLSNVIAFFTLLSTQVLASEKCNVQRVEMKCGLAMTAASYLKEQNKKQSIGEGRFQSYMIADSGTYKQTYDKDCNPVGWSISYVSQFSHPRLNNDSFYVGEMELSADGCSVKTTMIRGTNPVTDWLQ